MTSTAIVSTSRPERYAKQLAAHFSRKITATWDESSREGTLRFDLDDQISIVQMSTAENQLILQLTADPQAYDQIERIVALHLIRFGRADNLVVDWQRENSAGTKWTVDDLEH